ncbi:uncharacterized protein B0I36DRAFT_278050 [Microdochium trichocladiopsis]|uniref:Uncharacterized protein n=1 Tax=Microdochium trichocladiopsis TaxID=1682393 RepID=A0A9P9BLK7_9PEZI|nr:uncharacterized protein B0I36DRAFT_278050 [Microdochium trichocladiopsis]KAH7014192.1 hypothetical protein B0I36DRAFT_278050 [Microdochium trichocladiopsis]
MGGKQATRWQTFSRTKREEFDMKSSQRPYVTFEIGPGILESLVVEIWSHDQGHHDWYRLRPLMSPMLTLGSHLAWLTKTLRTLPLVDFMSSRGTYAHRRPCGSIQTDGHSAKPLRMTTRILTFIPGFHVSEKGLSLVCIPTPNTTNPSTSCGRSQYIPSVERP